jgi:hypothetical protein
MIVPGEGASIESAGMVHSHDWYLVSDFRHFDLAVGEMDRARELMHLFVFVVHIELNSYRYIYCIPLRWGESRTLVCTAA